MSFVPPFAPAVEPPAQPQSLLDLIKSLAMRAWNKWDWVDENKDFVVPVAVIVVLATILLAFWWLLHVDNVIIDVVSTQHYDIATLAAQTPIPTSTPAPTATRDAAMLESIDGILVITQGQNDLLKSIVDTIGVDNERLTTLENAPTLTPAFTSTPVPTATPQPTTDLSALQTQVSGLSTTVANQATAIATLSTPRPTRTPTP